MKALNKLFGKKAPEPAGDVLSGSLDGKTLFVGVGAMKTGTTWLSQYLKTHPEAYHSSLKEVNFFNTLVPNICRAMGPRRRLDILNSLILKYPAPQQIPAKTRAKIFDIAEIGHFALIIALGLALVLATVPAWGAWRNNVSAMTLAPGLSMGLLVSSR